MCTAVIETGAIALECSQGKGKVIMMCQTDVAHDVVILPRSLPPPPTVYRGAVLMTEQYLIFYTGNRYL